MIHIFVTREGVLTMNDISEKALQFNLMYYESICLGLEFIKILKIVCLLGEI
jgi:hypothetical protein